MTPFQSFLKYWFPIAAWWALIFTASSDAGSYNHSSRLVEPLLRWLVPDISEAAVRTAVLVVRKGAHLTEYAALSILCWRALRKPIRRDPRPWSWRQSAAALLLVVLYAASDEWHQTFVPSRDGCVRDVLIDSSGGVAGLLGLWWLGSRLGWWAAGRGKTGAEPRSDFRSQP
jgi:VanZ family protein